MIPKDEPERAHYSLMLAQTRLQTAEMSVMGALSALEVVTLGAGLRGPSEFSAQLDAALIEVRELQRAAFAARLRLLNIIQGPEQTEPARPEGEQQ